MVRKVVTAAVEFLPAAILIFGVVNVLVEPLSGLAIPVAVKAAVALVVGVLYVWLLRWLSSSGETTRWINTRSKKFVRFYEEWYSQDGIMHIYCSDLHWLEDPSRKAVVAAIRRKGAQAHVYLRDATGDVATDLFRSGVNFHVVPASVHLRVKFSLRVDQDHREVIIRSKVASVQARKGSTSKEKVQESTDPYLVSLVEEFLGALLALATKHTVL